MNRNGTTAPRRDSVCFTEKWNSHRIGAVIRAGVSLVMLTTGVLKLADLPTFIAALETWRLFSPALAFPVAVGVSGTEVLLGGLWLIGLNRRALDFACVGFLAVVSASYALESRLGAAPGCGCLGLLARYEWGREAGRRVLTRNGAVGGILVVGMILSMREKPDARRGGSYAP
ncbi:MAG: hypothetical protein AMXMBFR77_24300 [Phycisphaerales bacterium]|nr:MAG: hypothetical protein BroJett004_24820 [Planctomycetota bacterium]